VKTQVYSIWALIFDFLKRGKKFSTRNACIEMKKYLQYASMIDTLGNIKA
jgi:hypothetical protein